MATSRTIRRGLAARVSRAAPAGRGTVARGARALLAAAAGQYRAGRLPRAEALCRRVLDASPCHGEALHLLSLVEKQAGRPEVAAVLLERAVRVNPGYAAAHHALGNVLTQLGRLPRAVAAYRSALLAAPDHAEAYRDLADVLVELGRLDEAIATCRRGLSLAGDDPAIHLQLATALLSKGGLVEGYAEYEWRLRCPEYGAPTPATEAPRWDGWPLNGQTIVLQAEERLDDTVRFARYVSLVEESGGRVVLACRPELVSLLDRIDGVAEVVPTGARLPLHSTWAPLVSLPRLFDTSPETVPTGVPYLRPRSDLISAWAGHLAAGRLAAGTRPAGCASPGCASPGGGRPGGGRPGGGRPGDAQPVESIAGWLPDEDPFRVGLVWAGDPSRSEHARRSTTLAHLAPLARVPGVQFFGLQTGAAGSEVLAAPAGLPLVDLGPVLEDLEHMTAVVSQLDLVITVDSTVAHLAGALGRPVWVLLAAAHDWRWERGREDSSWYPAMRLFCQERPDDWDGLVERVTAELAMLVSSVLEL